MNPINIIAAVGLALGAVFGMAGTFAAQPNIQALLWAIDGAGLVMAAALLTVKYFREGHDLVGGRSRSCSSVSRGISRYRCAYWAC